MKLHFTKEWLMRQIELEEECESVECGIGPSTLFLQEMVKKYENNSTREQTDNSVQQDT